MVQIPRQVSLANTQTLQNHRQTHDRKRLQTYQQHLRKPAVQKKNANSIVIIPLQNLLILHYYAFFCKLAGRASKVFLDFLIGSTHEILSEPINYNFLYVSRDTLLIFEILSFYRFQAPFMSFRFQVAPCWPQSQDWKVMARPWVLPHATGQRGGKGMAGRETQRRQGALRHRRRKTVTASELPHEKTAVFPK